MKTNTIKRLITTLAAVAFTFAITTGAVYANSTVPLPDDGTVRTGNLVWLKNANCYGKVESFYTKMKAASLKSGDCGLTDKSTAGQWRVPTKFEMNVLWDYKSKFTNFQDDYYFLSDNNGWSPDPRFQNYNFIEGKDEDKVRFYLLPVRTAK